jgi:uncharacterized protein YraI
MRFFLWTLLAISIASSTMILSATAANAAQAYATSNVNMRAGPATDYPVVTTLSAGEVVTIYGCLGDGSWCDVSAADDRGWVSNAYLSAARGSRVGLAALALPSVVFSYAYWDNYYARRPWYNTWWGHGRPRPPHFNRPGYRPPAPGIRPPGARPPGVRPPHVRPPHVRPPHVRPPHVRPPGVHPPGARPPHFRPPHGTKPGIHPGNRPHVRPAHPAAKRPVFRVKRPQ